MILVPIIEKYSSFTKGEQQIADYILNNPEEALSKTASELASASHTSSAAIVRFSRKIGYDGYSDMKVGLAKYFSDRQHFEKDMIIQANDSYENCANKLITQIVEVCSSTADHIDYRVLSRVIAAINQASCVYLLGIGSSANVALDLQQKLLRINKRAFFLQDSQPSFNNNHNERRRRGRFFFLRNNGCCSRVGESSKTTRGIRYCNYGKSRFHHWPVCGFLFAYTCH